MAISFHPFLSHVFFLFDWGDHRRARMSRSAEAHEFWGPYMAHHMPSLAIFLACQVSKSKRLVTAAGCISCDSEHIQKGRLHMETETMMAGSRRLQGGEKYGSKVEEISFWVKRKGSLKGLLRSFVYFINLLFTFKGVDTGKVSWHSKGIVLALLLPLGQGVRCFRRWQSLPSCWFGRISRFGPHLT